MIQKLSQFTFCLVLLYASNSKAQIFNLEVIDYGGADAIKLFIDAEIQKVENEINKDLPSAPPQRLMEGMANSSVMAGKGIGSDYASNMSVFLIGAGAGLGADLEKDKTSNSDLSGVGIAPGFVIGKNLGFMDTETFLGMDTDRLNVYFNFMKYTFEKTLNDKPGERQEAGIDMFALGVHFRYDWIKGSGNKLLGWGGLKFHFGYELNRTTFTFTSQINETVDNTTSTGENLQGTLTGNPKATIESFTQSIPIEISTDVQLLYFLSLYTGLGADMNFGSAKGKGDLNANDSTLTCTGGVACAVQRDITVRATANINTQGNVTPLLFRGFVGVQFNLPYLRIFAQVDKAIGNELIGATAGVRFAF